jgi:hypothetical protein
MLGRIWMIFPDQYVFLVGFYRHKANGAPG